MSPSSAMRYFVIGLGLLSGVPFLHESSDAPFMITAIRNAWIVTQDAKRSILKGDIVIDGDRIVSVGPVYNGSADREIDATGDIVMPGMINTHTHIAMSVMKGVVDDLQFPDFLEKTFRIEPHGRGPRYRHPSRVHGDDARRYHHVHGPVLFRGRHSQGDL